MIWSPLWWKAAAERAISTAAQSALATIGADVLDVVAADWVGIASIAAGGAVLSLLKSVAATGVDPSTGPSLGTEQLRQR